MTTVIVVALLVALWVVVLWPRRPSDRSAMREHAAAVDALRRVVEGERE